MKSCIYQKTDPVDIPQAETRILKDVLALPWGFEIYSLLTRWNPLNLRRPVPLAATGKRALVVGMGPAGFTLAHHLLNDGHTVVGIDGLKIEPLPPSLSGVAATGERVPFEPVFDAAILNEPLDDRVMAGFGGVAEYGITVRWDKNFLKIIRLLLERRGRVRAFRRRAFRRDARYRRRVRARLRPCRRRGRRGPPDGARIAERPRDGRAHRVRLPDGAAAHRRGEDRIPSPTCSCALPVVVVGGGLTAIDTATEALAYYPVQVEKFLLRYETLVAEKGADGRRSRHGPRRNAKSPPNFSRTPARSAQNAPPPTARAARRASSSCLQAWGGATIAYRRRLIDSPSYTLNHEEVEKALEEGIRFAEGLTPVAVEVDAHGHACALEVSQHHNDGDGVWHEFGRSRLPARTILVAAGTQPNTVLAREDAAHFQLDGKYFRLLDEEGQLVTPGQGPRQTAAARRADRASCRRTRDELLRRPPSVVPRQCRQGDGERDAGLPDRLAPSRQGRARVARERRGVPRTPQRRAPRHRSCASNG